MHAVDLAALAIDKTCSQSHASGTKVTLTGTPEAGSPFTGWSGVCTGRGVYNLTVSADQRVSAAVMPTRTHTLSVSLLVSGLSTVMGSSISRPGTCSRLYATGTHIVSRGHTLRRQTVEIAETSHPAEKEHR